MLQPPRTRLVLALTLLSTSLLSACIVMPWGGRHRGHHGHHYSNEGRAAMAHTAPQAAVVIVTPGPQRR